jgi:uncharacterized membrane protein (Fun14 family)
MSNVENGFQQGGTDGKNALFVGGADNLMPTSFEFEISDGAANVCEVAITVKDGKGNTIAKPVSLDVFLSDAATGAGLTATTASGTVTAKTASGAVIGTYAAKKALRVQTLATGVFTLEITDTAKTGFYVAVNNPFTGLAEVSRQLVTADYGS